MARERVGADLDLGGPASAWGKDDLRGFLDMVGCGVRWGATVNDSTVWRDDRVREWNVVVESEPLGSALGEAILGRFAHEAARHAPEASACSLRDDRLGMTMTVRAPEVHEAADSAAHAFARALAATLWPRYKPSPVAQWRVRVTPVDVAAAV